MDILHGKGGPTKISPPPIFSEAIVAWAAWLESTKGRAPGTANKYLRHLQQLGRYATELQLDPWELTLEELEHFSGIVAHRMGLTPQTRRPIVAAVRGFFSWAKRNRYVSQSPAEQLAYPKIGRRLPRPAQMATAERLLMQPDIDTFTGLRDVAMIATLVGTGIRVSGLCRMNQGHLVWNQIDAHQRLSMVVKEKGGHERIVPVPNEAAMFIRAYLATPELREIDLTLPNGDRVLWATVNNRMVSEADYHGDARRISSRTVHDMLQRHGAKAGLPMDQCHPHALRHLFATELAEAGIDILERQTLMGHRDVRSTEIYTHLANRRLTKAVDQGNPLGRMRSSLVRDVRALATKVNAFPGADGA